MHLSEWNAARKAQMAERNTSAADGTGANTRVVFLLDMHTRELRVFWDETVEQSEFKSDTFPLPVAAAAGPGSLGPLLRTSALFTNVRRDRTSRSNVFSSHL
jgi:hypothetical protein